MCSAVAVGGEGFLRKVRPGGPGHPERAAGQVHGVWVAQFIVPDIREVPPISEQGNLAEIAERFGGVQQLRDAVNELQTLLYAA
jgi:hypothetical protein